MKVSSWHVYTSQTRGATKATRHPRLQRLLCKIGHHPVGQVWDCTDFRLGRSWSRCDACGRWWE